jgi:hypothetical protein
MFTRVVAVRSRVSFQHREIVRPIGFPQHGAGAFVNVMTNWSISTLACGFDTVAKVP